MGKKRRKVIDQDLPLPNFRMWQKYIDKVAIGLDFNLPFDRTLSEFDIGLHRLVQDSLTFAKVFEIENRVTKLLQMTKNTVSETKLPFPVVFIESHFKFRKRIYYGILLVETPDILHHLKCPEEELKETETLLKKYGKSHEIIIISVYREEGTLYFGQTFLFRTAYETKLSKAYAD